jgi:hypothetical protein
VLWVVGTFVVLFAISVVIIGAVALPHLRSERTRLLTPRGEELLREAKARVAKVSSSRS